jgi:hypothetical protein
VITANVSESVSPTEQLVSPDVLELVTRFIEQLDEDVNDEELTE